MNNFLLLILLAAFPALSTDMYLPAIPGLQVAWNISLMEANLSLVLFFVVFSVFLLVHGPISDRHGRKPVLIVGVGLYVLGSFLCSMAPGINMLIAARIVQGIGAAAASALALALTKDLYEGHERQKILAYLGVIIPLCPMVAPMLGGWMIEFMSWRWIFILQGGFALIAFFGAILMKEPMKFDMSAPKVSAFRRYLALSKNRMYLIYTVAFSFISLGFMAFIAGSADIYITEFGVSEKAFGLYFGLNALGLMVGAFTCSKATNRFSGMSILYVSLVGVFLSGVAMYVLHPESPIVFALSMFFVSAFVGLSRPVSNHMILEEVDKDAGAASSFMSFSYSLMGAAGMELVSLSWAYKPSVIAILSVIGSLAPLGALLITRRRS